MRPGKQKIINKQVTTLKGSNNWLCICVSGLVGKDGLLELMKQSHLFLKAGSDLEGGFERT